MTLSTSDGQPDGFKPPDFRGLRVLGGPFTQSGMSMQMGAGGTKVENNVTWSYQLSVAPGDARPVTIGAAHVSVGGQQSDARIRCRSRIGAGRARGAAPQRAPSLFPRGLFGDDEPEQEQPVASSATAAFLRAVADKKRPSSASR